VTDLRVEVGRRLVGEDHRRIVRERARSGRAASRRPEACGAGSPTARRARSRVAAPRRTRVLGRSRGPG
jgi:hypothetical protein